MTSTPYQTSPHTSFALDDHLESSDDGDPDSGGAPGGVGDEAIVVVAETRNLEACVGLHGVLALGGTTPQQHFALAKQCTDVELYPF